MREGGGMRERGRGVREGGREPCDWLVLHTQ